MRYQATPASAITNAAAIAPSVRFFQEAVVAGTTAAGTVAGADGGTDGVIMFLASGAGDVSRCKLIKSPPNPLWGLTLLPPPSIIGNRGKRDTTNQNQTLLAE
jgi:hypothetical protein